MVVQKQKYPKNEFKYLNIFLSQFFFTSETNQNINKEIIIQDVLKNYVNSKFYSVLQCYVYFYILMKASFIDWFDIAIQNIPPYCEIAKNY